MLKKVCLLTVGMMALSACSMFESWDDEGEDVVVEEVADSDVLSGAVYKVEAPYTVNNVLYIPAENYKYSQTGLASWYVPNDKDMVTANGEQYIPTAISARHKTLPLPSIVRITNLENGKSIVARVNDRGPMVNNRLIDVSQKGAELLDLPESEPVEVRVEILPAESQAVKAELVEAGRVWIENNNPNDLSLLPVEPVSQPSVMSTTSTQEIIYQPQPQVQPKPVVSQPKATGKGVYVRLGAFGSASNIAKADRAANTVAHVAHDTTMRNGQSLTIVKAGPFANRSEAMAAISRLRSMGYRDAYIAK